MKLRLFAVKNGYRYESGCKVTLISLTTECDLEITKEQILSVLKHKGFDEYTETLEFQEIYSIENYGQTEQDFHFIDNKIQTLFS